mmetsp:Transcript_127907/g.358082  ORF Transcript_127907/g.358082 Transcript_127907/m.358082 type:complete len:215 (+) Transcript_127907:436-1080(+)
MRSTRSAQSLFGDSLGQLSSRAFAHVDRLQVRHKGLHPPWHQDLVEQLVHLHHEGQRHRVREKIGDRLRIRQPESAGQQQAEGDAQLQHADEGRPADSMLRNAIDGEDVAASQLAYRECVGGHLLMQMPDHQEEVESRPQHLGDAQRPHEDHDAGQQRACLQALDEASARKVSRLRIGLRLQTVRRQRVVLHMHTWSATIFETVCHKSLRRSCM